MDVRFFVFFLDITYIFAMSLVKKDKKYAKHIGVDKIRHINRFCLHMLKKLHLCSFLDITLSLSFISFS